MGTVHILHGLTLPTKSGAMIRLERQFDTSTLTIMGLSPLPICQSLRGHHGLYRIAQRETSQALDVRTEKILADELGWRALSVIADQRIRCNDPATYGNKNVHRKVRAAERAGVTVQIITGGISDELRQEIHKGIREWQSSAQAYRCILLWFARGLIAGIVPISLGGIKMERLVA